MSKMKDSGIEWIGEIPENWQLYTIGSIFKTRNIKVNDKDYPPLSVSKGGVVPQLENVAKTNANDNRKLVLKNDFAINSRSDRKQSCGLSLLDGSISLINTVIYPQSTSLIEPLYTDYLLKNYGFAEEFYRWGHGIVADLWTTRWQEMKNIIVPLPSIDEQKKIYEAIAHKSNSIDKLLSNQEKQIENLKAYKQSLITETVTKGLNPNVKMKDSEIYYIGEMPSNWDISRFKNIATLSNGKEIRTTEGNIPVYGSGGIFKYTSEYIFDGVSLLMGRKGTIDRPMLVDGKFWTVDTMFYTSNIKNIEPKYLYYCAISIFDFKFYKSGSVLPSMTQSEINNIFLPLPSIVEQKQIIEYLDGKCYRLDKLIEIKQQKIEKLNEYKKSLIYECVTGKREVI